MTNEELTEVVGGIGWGFWTAIGAGVSFLFGLFEGLINPVKCGK